MTALSQSTKRKLSLLQLAEELGNVAKAAKIMGFHRDTFYEVRKAFQSGGVAALVEQKRGPRNAHPQPGLAADRREDPGVLLGQAFPRCAASRQRASAAGTDGVIVRGPRRMAAPRSAKPLQAADEAGSRIPR